MKPQTVTDVQIAFAADVSSLMPAMDDIPVEFMSQRNTWVQFQQAWFYGGLPHVKFEMQPGIDQHLAIRHLQAIQSSFEPRHEHKEAAVAYLSSLWFVRVEADGKVYGGEVKSARG